MDFATHEAHVLNPHATRTCIGEAIDQMAKSFWMWDGNPWVLVYVDVDIGPHGASSSFRVHGRLGVSFLPFRSKPPSSHVFAHAVSGQEVVHMGASELDRSPGDRSNGVKGGGSTNIYLIKSIHSGTADYGELGFQVLTYIFSLEEGGTSDVHGSSQNIHEKSTYRIAVICVKLMYGKTAFLLEVDILIREY